MSFLCNLYVFTSLIVQTCSVRVAQTELEATGIAEDADVQNECTNRCKPSYASSYQKSCTNGACTIKCRCGDGRSMEINEGNPSHDSGPSAKVFPSSRFTDFGGFDDFDNWGGFHRRGSQENKPGRQIENNADKEEEYVQDPKPKPIASGAFGTKNGAEGWLADHNHFRGLHGAQPVAWDVDLEAKAQAWASKLNTGNVLQHSDAYNTWPPSGENLAWGYGGCRSKHYKGNYDQHCAMASWYEEYYLWNGVGDWKRVGGIGHFTAMVWKGIDAIGCASAGKNYVCEYGSSKCKTRGARKGGHQCWGSTPSHLPNFNQNDCSGGACVEGRK